VYGLPPQTSYKWVLTSDFLHLQPYNIPKDLMDQLRISRFCNTVTETLYCDGSEPGGVIPSSERTLVLDQLHNEYSELERELGPETSSKWPTIPKTHYLTSCSYQSVAFISRQRPPKLFRLLPSSSLSKSRRWFPKPLQRNLRLSPESLRL
jgi:hypothetical protein